MNENYFAVLLSDVKEVIEVPQFISLPQSPDYFLGLMNLRGQVISAIDLKKNRRYVKYILPVFFGSIVAFLLSIPPHSEFSKASLNSITSGRSKADSLTINFWKFTINAIGLIYPPIYKIGPNNKAYEIS